MAGEERRSDGRAQPNVGKSEYTEVVPGVFYFGPPRGPEATTIMPRPILTAVDAPEPARKAQKMRGLRARLASWLARRLEAVVRRLGGTD